MNIITSVLYTIGLVITTVAIGISSLFSGGNFGATIPQSVAIFSTTLATEISSTATSFTLTSGTTADATTLSGFYGFVIDSGTSSEEFVTATCTDTACTGATRGLSVVTGDTTISALKKTHRKGASVKITDHPVLTVISRIINGDESFPNNISIGSTISTGSTAVFGGKATYFNTETIDDAKDLTSKAYVDAVVVSGAPVASTTVKGIVEEATDAELAAGTAAGGTAARLFAGGASHNETPAAGKVPVAASSGMLLDGWLGLTTAGDMCYSDGTDFGRLAIGTTNYYLYSTGSAPAWGGANLNEANTFFGATDISGAEAETLTGFATEASTFWGSTDISAAEAETLTGGSSSNASALHEHTTGTLRSIVIGWTNGGGELLDDDDIVIPGIEASIAGASIQTYDGFVMPIACTATTIYFQGSTEQITGTASVSIAVGSLLRFRWEATGNIMYLQDDGVDTALYADTGSTTSVSVSILCKSI